jgi:hypothetical protein
LSGGSERNQEVAGTAGITSAQGPAPATSDLGGEQAAAQRLFAGPRAARTLNVHLGPSEDYAIIGLVPRNGRLDIVGRNEAGDWIAIAFTPGSSFHGWIPGSAVLGIQDSRALSIVPVVPIRSP